MPAPHRLGMSAATLALLGTSGILSSTRSTHASFSSAAIATMALVVGASACQVQVVVLLDTKGL